MSRRSSSESLAEVLRENPPALDEFARARLERRLVQAALAPRPVRRRPRVVLAASVTLGLAAAALLGFVLITDEGDAGAVPTAHFERREAATALERGTLDEGSALRTAKDEVAELRVAGARALVGAASRVRIVRLARDELTFALEEGAIDVTFHPEERGRERVTLETPEARVEVVGTVFRVVTRSGATEVSVSEGTVRVVPRSGGGPRLVRAGESTRVARDEVEHEPSAERPDQPPAAEAIADVPQDEALVVDVPPVEAAADNPAPAAADAVERAPTSPTERLEHARELIAQGRAPAAQRVLAALRRSSAPVEVRAEAWMLTADVHLRANRFEAAARAYANAEREGRGTSSGAIAVFSLARLQHRRLGDRDAARASYERYLALAPNGPLASQAQRALCSLGADERCEAP